MGGKARRRREKNYLNAHGGGNGRLPPPPDFSTLDAVPSKLRKLMSLTGVKESNNGAKKQKVDAGVKESSNGADKQKVGADEQKRQRAEDELGVLDANDRRGDDDGELVGEDFDHVDENVNDDTYEKKKKKRKRKQVDDLRFEALDKLAGAGSKRKERRKIRNEEKKKKRKGIKAQDDFLNRDDVKFGDVVQAPPKLVVPKTFKINKDAFQERQRIQAVEAYRKRKGWTSRPGLQLIPSFSTDPGCISIKRADSGC